MLTVRIGVRLTEVFWPRFVERDGVILLESVRPSEPAPGGHPSLSEYERFQNHTHIQDLFRWDVPTVHDSELDMERPDASSREHASAWKLAQQLAAMWLAKLRHDFPQFHFRVYASRLDDPIVHFHRIRSSESEWISDEDAVEGIARGDFIVLDSRKSPSGSGVAAS